MWFPETLTEAQRAADLDLLSPAYKKRNAGTTVSSIALRRLEKQKAMKRSRGGWGLGSNRQTEHTEQPSQSVRHRANLPAPQKPCQIHRQLKLQATMCRRACRRPCCHPCPGGSHGQLAPRLTFPALSFPMRVPAKLWGTVGCSCMPGCRHTHACCWQCCTSMLNS